MNMLLFSLVIAAVLVVVAAPEPNVELGSAADYVILAKTGITNVVTSTITGDIAVSPIAATAMTGFVFTMDPNGEFATAPQISGQVFASNYATPTPTNLITAVSDMQAAYTNALGRTNSDTARKNLNGGTLGGVHPGGPNNQLTPGLYTFGSLVTIAGDLHFNGICSIACILLLFCTDILTPQTHKTRVVPSLITPQVPASTSSR
jgi:hypothetical protein